MNVVSFRIAQRSSHLRFPAALWHRLAGKLTFIPFICGYLFNWRSGSSQRRKCALADLMEALSGYRL